MLQVVSPIFYFTIDPEKILSVVLRVCVCVAGIESNQKVMTIHGRVTVIGTQSSTMQKEGKTGWVARVKREKKT